MRKSFVPTLVACNFAVSVLDSPAANCPIVPKVSPMSPQLGDVARSAQISNSPPAIAMLPEFLTVIVTLNVLLTAGDLGK
jgi:hypothetical protein